MKYFKVYELVSKYLYEQRGDEVVSLFNPELLIALDDLRDFFGVPLTVNNWHSGGEFQMRGWRTHQEAKDLGAKVVSQHELGNAIDLDVAGISADEARHQIIVNKDHPLLIRITRLEQLVHWVHFDLKILEPGLIRIHLFGKN